MRTRWLLLKVDVYKAWIILLIKELMCMPFKVGLIKFAWLQTLKMMLNWSLHDYMTHGGWCNTIDHGHWTKNLHDWLQCLMLNINLWSQGGLLFAFIFQVHAPSINQRMASNEWRWIEMTQMHNGIVFKHILLWMHDQKLHVYISPLKLPLYSHYHHTKLGCLWNNITTSFNHSHKWTK
jgi:hypothetical protein